MKILAFNFNNILTEVINELEKQEHEILPIDGKPSTLKKCDVAVVWNEVESSGWKPMIDKLHKLGKRVILVQHGRRGISRIYPPFNEKLLSDVVCVWGKNDVSRLIQSGVPLEKIKVTGSTIFSKLKPRVPHKGFNVVFSPDHWGGEDIAENFIVANELRKIKGVNIITKGLIGYQEIEMYDNLVMSDRREPDHLDICTDVLSKADLIVSLSESTFEMMAQVLDIPIVIADIWIPKACDGDDRYKEYKREFSNACTLSSLDKLKDVIMFYKKHPEYLREERKQIVINDGGDTINPLQELIKIITDEKIS
jgi:hypothetical protein